MIKKILFYVALALLLWIFYTQNEHHGRIFSWAKYDIECGRFFKSGDYKNAAGCYKKAIKEHNESPKFRYFLASAMYFNKEYPGAVYHSTYIIGKLKSLNYALRANQIYEASNKLFKETKKPDDYMHLLNSITFWDKKMPLRVWIQPSNLNIDLRYTLSAWQKALEPLITFELTLNKYDADITVNFVDSRQMLKLCNKNSKEGSGKASDIIAGCTLLEYKGPIITRANIYLDYFDKRNSRFTNGIIYSVLMHEMGHAIGINGHSDSKYDVMYPYSNDYNYIRRPSIRDINTAGRLYLR